jgi:creatinine amidohydrolase
MIERLTSMPRGVKAGLGLFFSLMILGFTQFAHSQERLSVFLDDLTWTELRDEIAVGKTTVIVPIGGTEQSGPAIALGKHNRRVKLLSQRIADALGNAIVAPVIAYVPEGNLSPPSGHMRFPGTISVPDAAFDQILEYAALSLKLHG